MPHVIVKLWPGKSEAQQATLAAAIVKDVTKVLHYGEESLSVSMEEVPASEWLEKVYKPHIEARPDQLYKPPGYRPEDL
jgi:4-oxalocrotonate tautomerase